MDTKKIVLIKLSKGLVGDINSNFIGMIFVGKMLMAALSREDLTEANRVPFYLYIDEFQNFLTDSVYSILSEARKYQLSLTVAHQFINQLVVNNASKIRDAVFGNVGTRVYMRVGADDAKFLEQELTPYYTSQDLQNQANGWAYTKLLVDGSYPPPFTMHTWFGYSPNDMIGEPNPAEVVAALRKQSSMKYGRALADVDAEILQRGAGSELATASPGDLDLLKAFNLHPQATAAPPLAASQSSQIKIN